MVFAMPITILPCIPLIQLDLMCGKDEGSIQKYNFRTLDRSISLELRIETYCKSVSLQLLTIKKSENTLRGSKPYITIVFYGRANISGLNGKEETDA